MQLMQKKGLAKNKIIDIISCVHEEDTMNHQQIAELKKWIFKEIS